MIVQLILQVIFGLILKGFDNLPTWVENSSFYDMTTLFRFLDKAFVIFPVDLFFTCIASITFWLSLQFVWAVVEWVYNKVPGIN